MTLHLPFELEYWFINVFAGNITVFMVIAFVVIAFMAAYFRMPNIIYGYMLAVFVIVMSAYSGEWLFLGIVMIGLFVGWVISRAMRN